MSDNPNNPDAQAESSPAGAQNTEHMIPKSRLDQVLGERDELRDRLVRLESAIQERETQELTEQNRYKELYEKAQKELETLKAAQETASRYQEALQTTNAARLERIPEDKRSLVPEYDDPVALGTWLDKNLQLLAEPGKPSPAKLDGGAGPGGGTQNTLGKLTDQERMLAAAAGLSEEQYLKRKAARGEPLKLSQHNKPPPTQET